jgi:DNA-directed RNA polymerase beta subunit
MRLKHMVKDKINYRARGPRTLLTRQTVQGRANDGGLRIGEMERDGVIAHGASHFLNESFLVRGDEYYMAVCNKTGAISIYNKHKSLFLSPFADGPIHYYNTVDGKLNIENVSKFGRSFSILKIPYALKLLIQELQVMNIQMRIITDDNIDQLMSMSYSKNIIELTKNADMFKDITSDKENSNMNEFIQNYIRHINMKIRSNENKINTKWFK